MEFLSNKLFLEHGMLKNSRLQTINISKYHQQSIGNFIKGLVRHDNKYLECFYFIVLVKIVYFCVEN